MEIQLRRAEKGLTVAFRGRLASLVARETGANVSDVFLESFDDLS